MHLLKETVLYYSMNNNQYYKERTDLWLTRLCIKRLKHFKRKGFTKAEIIREIGLNK